MSHAAVLPRPSESAVVERFLVERLGSDHSRRAYRDDWRKWTTWLKETRGISPRKASASAVQAWVDEMATDRIGRSVRQRALSVLRSIYGTFVVEGLIGANPAREARNPK